MAHHQVQVIAPNLKSLSALVVVAPSANSCLYWSRYLSELKLFFRVRVQCINHHEMRIIVESSELGECCQQVGDIRSLLCRYVDVDLVTISVHSHVLLIMMYRMLDLCDEKLMTHLPFLLLLQSLMWQLLREISPSSWVEPKRECYSTVTRTESWRVTHPSRMQV